MDPNPVPTPWKERLRRGWIVLPLLLLGLGQFHLHFQLHQLGQETPLKTFRVERLEVFNEAGHPVVILGAYEGHGIIAVGDAQANPRIGLAGDPEVGHIRLMQASQGEVIHLGADTGGNGGIEVRTRKGIAHLGASTTDTPALSLDSGESSLFLGYRNDNDREPAINLYQGQETRVRIEALEGRGVVRVWGPGERFGKVFLPRY
ncbi:MAG: hypothetical protein HYW07_20370 [Candidatus Latescibacteria bacterium]|nr:hypothetical protein [Candidatus Latescibacterota bacterium]